MLLSARGHGETKARGRCGVHWTQDLSQQISPISGFDQAYSCLLLRGVGTRLSQTLHICW